MRWVPAIRRDTNLLRTFEELEELGVRSVRTWGLPKDGEASVLYLMVGSGFTGDPEGINVIAECAASNNAEKLGSADADESQLFVWVDAVVSRHPLRT